MTSKKKIILLCGISILATSACSYRGMYNSVKTNNLRECDQFVGQKREMCREQYEKDYDEYERERQEVLNGNQARPEDDNE